MNNSVRTRIAPSPTGFPHVGTVFQALFDFVYARKHDGKFLLRIEDTDQSRKVEGAEAVLIEALKYYGLTPDESPDNPGAVGPYRQSERLEIYQKYAHELVQAGHAYYCFCSSERLDQVRKDMQALGKPPMYDQHCRKLNLAEAESRTLTEPHVIRMKVPTNRTIVLQDLIRGEISFDASVVDDQVILKSDGFPTYHLAVVVDDHLMKISHVVRGEEWISSAPKHVLLYEYFGWEMPKWIHLPLLRNPDRSKIGKRHGHTSVQWYRDRGYLIEAVLNFLSSRVWNHPEGKEVYGLDELIQHFEFEDMHIQGPIVDLAKLDWLNGQWIRSLSIEEMAERLVPYLKLSLEHDQLIKLLPLVSERLVVLSDINVLLEYFVTPPELDAALLNKQYRQDGLALPEYLAKCRELLLGVEDWRATTLEETCRALQVELELKPKHAFMALRVALTGQVATPPLFDVMEHLGKDEVLLRLGAAERVLS